MNNFDKLHYFYFNKMNSTLEKISAEEWHYKQKSISIPKSFMNQIVLNFFIIEGYRDAAIEFSKEAGI